VLDVVEPWEPKCPQNIRAALLATVPFLPAVAVTTMVVTYVVPGDTSLRAQVGPDQASAAKDAPGRESVSRTALRDVRRAINEFRDESFEAMVRTRKHLLATLTLTGAAAVLISATAIRGCSP
jgi:hypothetical protein